jgi:hypothetical protein
LTIFHSSSGSDLLNIQIRFVHLMIGSSNGDDGLHAHEIGQPWSR